MNRAYTVESRKDYNDVFENYCGDFIYADSELEAIELYKQWLLDNGMSDKEVENLEYKAH